MRILSHAIRLAAWTALILLPVHQAGAAICIVMSNESAQFSETIEGFRKHLAQHGFFEQIKIHSLSRDGAQPTDIAHSLSQAKATHLLALGSHASLLVSQGNFGLPVIAGLVFSMGDLAGAPNTGGVYLDIDIETQLALIKRLFPQAGRVGVLYSMENEGKIAEASRISQKLGLKLEAKEAFSPKDIPLALESVGKRADVLWGLMDKVVLTPETTKQMLLFSLRNELPFVGPSENWAKAGATAAFSWNFEDLGVQCAEILLKLLKGARTADIPVAGPRKIEYVLNLKIADQLKIEFSPDIINSAKRVFKGE